MRVLIADDQRSVGTSLAELVRHCNHEIVGVVGSGVEAIQAYSLHHPDVVLMDYWMPKLNGATACRNIIAKDPTARIILVSGWSPSNGIVGDSGAVALLSETDRHHRPLRCPQQRRPNFAVSHRNPGSISHASIFSVSAVSFQSFRFQRFQ